MGRIDEPPCDDGRTLCGIKSEKIHTNKTLQVQCAMTQDEMEDRIARLEQAQEAQRNSWAQCSRFAFGAAVLLAVLTMASAIVGILAHKTDPITQVFGATMTLTLFLGLAFQRATAALQPAQPTSGR